MSLWSTSLLVFLGTAIALDVKAQCVEGGMTDGPVQVGLGPADFMGGDFAVARSACPRSGVAIREQGFLLSVLDELTDSPTRDFGAYLGVDTNIAASFRYTPRLAFFGSIDVLQYRNSTNAVISTSQTSFGPVSLGAEYTVQSTDTWQVAAQARLTAPTSTLYENVWPFGLEIGAAGRMKIAGLSWLALDGYVGVLGSAAFGAGNPQPRVGVDALVGAQASPFRHVNFVLDVDCLFAYAYPLDYCAAAPGVRAQIWQGLGAELGLMLPFAGGSRYNVAGALQVSYRLERT